jgi:glycosyltransferase involved in cell wall biosynthesis
LTRVLFLTESFHPTLGGGETHILRLGRALAARGDAATVVTRRAEPGWPAEETLDGIRVLRVGSPGPALRGKYRMLPAAFREALRQAGRHDVVVVRATRVLGVPGLLAARARARPVVMQPEVNGELSGEVYTWGRFANGSWVARGVRAGVAIRNLWLRDADAFVAMSREIAGELASAGVPPHKIALIPHGVDLERFRPAAPAEKQQLRAALGLADSDLVVTYTGRLLRGKGLEALLEAFAASLEREPALRLVIVGSGAAQSLSVEDALRARAAQAPLAGRVVFAGHVDDVAPYLRASDVFVFPSLFEGLGISLVEAAACGLACVGSRTGGIVDVIEHERSGLLLAPGDVTALAEAILRLARDPGSRSALGAGARAAAVARFDETAATEVYRALFRELARA